ncbi:hypothetical protein JG687_00009699 [Phytophthora cactorum]|uniref:Uncharacterized protein n=1 Tax=Phytophthora cactorum TaxID=29920 RepID=A0A8T1UED9_9STRA|nr:hypothetical protein JG687_00009699 [Phytophthora cactorum]
MVASAKMAKLKRYRALGSAKTLSDDTELDLLEWLVAVRRNDMPVSATMVRLLFDERTVEQAECETPNVNNELAEILESLSCVDSVVGEVAWDDDVVGRCL